MRYYIDNNKNDTNYTKEFKTSSDARNWVINNLDLSLKWNYMELLYIKHIDKKKIYKYKVEKEIKEKKEKKVMIFTGKEKKSLITKEVKNIKYLVGIFKAQIPFYLGEVILSTRTAFVFKHNLLDEPWLEFKIEIVKNQEVIEAKKITERDKLTNDIKKGASKDNKKLLDIMIEKGKMEIVVADLSKF